MNPKNRITIEEVKNHLTEWFGSNWDNQSGGQIYAMVVDLLAKVGTEITSEEDEEEEVNFGRRFDEYDLSDEDEEYKNSTRRFDEVEDFEGE